MRAAEPPSGSRAPGGAALVVLAVLLVTVDTRAFGLIPDGKEMLSASAAVTRFLEIGISRDFPNGPRRPGGDAVSRYGMGLSLVESVPGIATRIVRTVFASAPSSPIFVLVPLACLVVAAWAITRALLLTAVTPAWAGAMGCGLVLATPLWGYAASDYGEPLQACCIALALLAVVESRKNPASRKWQVALGTAAGFAILTKTLLVVAVAPLLLVAVIGRKKREDFLEGKREESEDRIKKKEAHRRAARQAARELGSRRGRPAPRSPSFAPPWPLLLSFAGILFLWVFFELVRFGKLFGGYAGETFSYPLFTGLLRLTIFPNKGLFWYAPIVLLAPFGFVALHRRDARLALAFALSPAALLLSASAWWAWDGQAGWGPRLLLPALPPLVALAGVALSTSRGARAAGAVALGLGACVNVLGALVPFPTVYALADVVVPQLIPESRAEGTEYEIERGADGILRATAPHHLSLTPSWSPIRIHALLLRAKLRGDAAGLLASEGIPGLDPPFRPVLPMDPAPALLLALKPVRVGWGREFFSTGKVGREGFPDPWGEATRDQAIRAIDTKRFERAKKLGEELLGRKGKDADSDSSNDPRAVALVAESIRLGGGPGAGGSAASTDDRAAASLFFLSKQISLSSSSSSSLSCYPWLLFVRSMAAPPGDLSCMPEAQRDGFARGLEIARQRRWPLTSWVRAARGQQP